MAVAGHQLATVPADARERAEPVEFRLEDELGMVERVRDAQQAHRTQELLRRATKLGWVLVIILAMAHSALSAHSGSMRLERRAGR